MSEWDEAQERMDEAEDIPGDESFDEFDGIDDLDEAEAVDDVPDEVRAELEALAAAEAEQQDALAEALAASNRALEAQREATRAAVARYREALLQADADLPPDLVQGETLEDVDASVAAARSAVALIRERVTAEVREEWRGFPVGSPAREHPSTHSMTPAEKIAVGLSERVTY
ncbi:MAG: hypothetical protein AB7G21_06165 [Dehalococcoidia bacterium]